MSKFSIRQFIEKYYSQYYSIEIYFASPSCPQLEHSRIPVSLRRVE